MPVTSNEVSKSCDSNDQNHLWSPLRLNAVRNSPPPRAPRRCKQWRQQEIMQPRLKCSCCVSGGGNCQRSPPVNAPQFHLRRARCIYAACGPPAPPKAARQGAASLHHCAARRARAGRHGRCVPPAARRDRGETSMPRAARATRPPYPATAGGGPVPGGTCCHRRVAIAARRPVPLSRRVPPVSACGGPKQGGACVCRHRRVAITARQARPVPLSAE